MIEKSVLSADKCYQNDWFQKSDLWKMFGKSLNSFLVYFTSFFFFFEIENFKDMLYVLAN